MDAESAPSSTPQSADGVDAQPDDNGVTVADTNPETSSTPNAESETVNDGEGTQKDPSETNLISKTEEESNKNEGDKANASEETPDASPAEESVKSEEPKAAPAEAHEAPAATNDPDPAPIVNESADANDNSCEDTGTADEHESHTIKSEKADSESCEKDQSPKEGKGCDGGEDKLESAKEEKAQESDSNIPAIVTEGDVQETTEQPLAEDEKSDSGVEQSSEAPVTSSEETHEAPTDGTAGKTLNAQNVEEPSRHDQREIASDQTPAEAKETSEIQGQANDISPLAQSDSADTQDDVDSLRAKLEESKTINDALELQMDGLKEDNEALRKKVKELEDDLDRIRTGRQEGMKIQADYLARELSQQQDTEKYLREKLAEVLQEKEQSERRVKDFQLRLKRFAKDDQSKDARLTKMDAELRDIRQQVQIMENMMDEETLRQVHERKASGKPNGPSDGTGQASTQRISRTSPPPPQSKTCIIL